MRALTVQQPWAWAIVHGGKDVENRTQAWGYRGPLAIHAGARISDRGVESPLIQPEGTTEHRVTMAEGEARLLYVTGRYPNARKWGVRLPLGAVIGVVDLVGVHVSMSIGPLPPLDEQPACCESPWAEQGYDEHSGRTRRDVVHLVLANPRPLSMPIPARGRLGLWTPDAELLARIREQVPA